MRINRDPVQRAAAPTRLGGALVLVGSVLALGVAVGAAALQEEPGSARPAEGPAQGAPVAEPPPATLVSLAERVAALERSWAQARVELRLTRLEVAAGERGGGAPAAGGETALTDLERRVARLERAGDPVVDVRQLDSRLRRLESRVDSVERAVR